MDSNNWEELNYFSNITPQNADLNRGPWYNLESKIRYLDRKNVDKIYVITGTYYTGKSICKLPNVKISNIISNCYWKIINIITDKGVYRVSFILDQSASRIANFCNYQTSIQDISKIADLKFGYSDRIENSKELLNMLGCTN